MSLSLANKVAIVTGASRGIGHGIALELAKRGAKVHYQSRCKTYMTLIEKQVVITYISPSSEAAVEDLISQIASLNNGSAAVKVSADLSTLEAPKAIVDATIAAFGPHIDILVNNAGVVQQIPFADLTPENFAAVYDVNVRGLIFMTQAVLPHLRAPGRIINISSIAARNGFVASASYCSSKAAVEGFTRSLAKEIGAHGHTANAVEPGPVDGDMIKKIPKELVAMQLKETPVEHRMAQPKDIAEIVAFLAEEQSRWISGQTLSASGGMYMI